MPLTESEIAYCINAFRPYHRVLPEELSFVIRNHNNKEDCPVSLLNKVDESVGRNYRN